MSGEDQVLPSPEDVKNMDPKEVDQASRDYLDSNLDASLSMIASHLRVEYAMMCQEAAKQLVMGMHKIADEAISLYVRSKQPTLSSGLEMPVKGKVKARY